MTTGSTVIFGAALALGGMGFSTEAHAQASAHEAEAHAQANAHEAEAHAQAHAAEENQNRQYCAPLDPSTLPNENDSAARDAVAAAIQLCTNERESELTEGDRVTRRWSRVSAGGAVGALVSGLTAQAAGTTNAWVAVGLAPVLADDVQQRRRVVGIQHDFVARLAQLQCRADFLLEEQGYMSNDSNALNENATALENLIAAAMRHVVWDAEPGTPEAQFKAIVSEALRLVEQASLLEAYVGSLRADKGVERLEAISYNFLVAEYERMRRGTLARPELTFRSILAAPLRAAANVVGGPGQAAPIAYNSLVVPESSTFGARYVVSASVTSAEITALNLRLAAPHYLWAPPNRQAQARAILERAQQLSVEGVELRRYLLQFVDAATTENPTACPTYRAPGSDPEQPAPTAPKNEPAPQAEG